MKEVYEQIENCISFVAVALLLVSGMAAAQNDHVKRVMNGRTGQLGTCLATAQAVA
jgi:hypothetical protein